MRMESPVAISALPREHPLRRRFGLLHGVSTLLLIAQVVAAGAVVVVDEPVMLSRKDDEASQST